MIVIELKACMGIQLYEGEAVLGPRFFDDVCDHTHGPYSMWDAVAWLEVEGLKHPAQGTVILSSPNPFKYLLV